jgi:Ca2+-binding EF-hand superfamily protein
LDDLKVVASELEDDRTEQELKEMITEADMIDHDGFVNQEEFVRIIRRRG